MDFDPFEVLMNEHRVIEKNLEVMAVIINKILSGDNVPVEDLEKIVDFIKTFADRCHHGKEEKNLFPILEMRGIPKEGGPIGVMLMEHEEGKSYVKGMLEGIKKKKKGNLDGYKKFAEFADNYIKLLREHIFKEDNILFQMGRSAITSEDIKSLEKKYEEVERELGEGVHEKYITLVEELYKKYKQA